MSKPILEYHQNSSISCKQTIMVYLVYIFQDLENMKVFPAHHTNTGYPHDIICVGLRTIGSYTLRNNCIPFEELWHSDIKRLEYPNMVVTFFVIKLISVQLSEKLIFAFFFFFFFLIFFFLILNFNF